MRGTTRRGVRVGQATAAQQRTGRAGAYRSVLEAEGWQGALGGRTRHGREAVRVVGRAVCSGADREVL